MKSDGSQFHQYQQNEQSPLTSNHKKTITTTKHKKTKTFGVRNADLV